MRKGVWHKGNWSIRDRRLLALHWQADGGMRSAQRSHRQVERCNLAGGPWLAVRCNASVQAGQNDGRCGIGLGLGWVSRWVWGSCREAASLPRRQCWWAGQRATGEAPAVNQASGLGQAQLAGPRALCCAHSAACGLVEKAHWHFNHVLALTPARGRAQCRQRWWWWWWRARRWRQLR